MPTEFGARVAERIPLSTDRKRVRPLHFQGSIGTLVESTPSAGLDGGVLADRVTLGVLCVHGIGEQRGGDILVTWLDTIVAVINGATRGRVNAIVESADLGSHTGDGEPIPAHAVVRIRGDGVDETWMFAEAWWAETFRAPPFTQLVTWSVRAIPWTIGMHAAQRFHRAS